MFSHEAGWFYAPQLSNQENNTVSVGSDQHPPLHSSWFRLKVPLGYRCALTSIVNALSTHPTTTLAVWLFRQPVTIPSIAQAFCGHASAQPSTDVAAEACILDTPLLLFRAREVAGIF